MSQIGQFREIKTHTFRRTNLRQQQLVYNKKIEEINEIKH